MKKVIVLHPDLGIGGAERLIIDICLALIKSKHQVTLFTGYHDSTRCFEETKDKSINLQVVGQWIPRAILGKFHALLAYLKMIYIAIYIIIARYQYDVVICDQVSACIPVFKYLDFCNKPKIIFYCHFPDLLLVRGRSFIRTFYRKPINMLEECTTLLADTLLVNSKFTASIVKKTFNTRDKELTILYPCVDVKNLTRLSETKITSATSNTLADVLEQCKETFTMISLNRFERKKNLDLAVDSFARFKESHDELGKSSLLKARLIMAGGYDDRLDECRDYYRDLHDKVAKSQLDDYVTFIRNPSDLEKVLLLKSCHVVLYTPENEHFGIVPLEAMALKRPVIALKSGGVIETVVDRETGLLCDPGNDSQFSVAMSSLYDNINLCTSLGEAGYTRVCRNFDIEIFRSKLDDLCKLS